jgi:hypothetical protein
MLPSLNYGSKDLKYTFLSKIFKIAEKQPNIKSAAKYLPTKTGN